MKNHLCRFALFFVLIGMPSFSRAQSGHGGSGDTSFSGSQFATASLGVAWNPNPESDLAGYKIHYREIGVTPWTTVDVGNVTSFTIGNMKNATAYEIAATAYNNSGLESAFSDSIFPVTEPYVPNEPPKPQASNLGITHIDTNGDGQPDVTRVKLDLKGGKEGVLYELQVSEDLENWTKSANVILGEDGELTSFEFDWPLGTQPPKMFFRFKWNEPSS